MATNKKMQSLVAQAVRRTRNFIDALSVLSREEALQLKVRAAAKSKRAEAKAKAEYDTLAPSILADMQNLGVEEVVASPFAFAQLKAPSSAIPADERGARIFAELCAKFGEGIAIRLVEVKVETRVITTYKLRRDIMENLSPAEQVAVLEIIGNKPALVVDFPTAAAKSGKTPAERRAKRKSSR